MEQGSETELKSMVSKIKSYLNKRLDYVKLLLIERTARLAADVITNGIVVICFVLAFILATVTLGYYLSVQMGSYAKGFGCVSLMYIGVAILITAAKSRFEKAIRNLAIKKYFNKLQDNEDEHS